MVTIQNSTDLTLAVENIDDFEKLSLFAFSLCHYLRGHLEYPVCKNLFQKIKPYVGFRSYIGHIPILKISDHMKMKRDHQRFLYEYLLWIRDFQDVAGLRTTIRRNRYRTFKYIPAKKVEAIFNDTTFDLTPKKYPWSIRRMALEIREGDKFNEVGVLGDFCEDLGFKEEADHFHSSDFHTYGCRYIHQMCKEPS